MFLYPDESALAWANNAKFRPVAGPPFPGYVVKKLILDLFDPLTILDSLDPIIGQGTNPRSMSGLDPLNDKTIYTFEDFVIPKGGEYFFSPSITALAETIGKA